MFESLSKYYVFFGLLALFLNDVGCITENTESTKAANYLESVNSSDIYTDFQEKLSQVDNSRPLETNITALNINSFPKNTKYEASKEIDEDKVIVGYYADWKANDLPPESIPYSRLTHLNYGFAILDESNKLKLDSGKTLGKVVELAHKYSVKVLISIGGWSGSKYFSSMVKDDKKIADFISECDNLIEKYDLDGLDIDWEFPGKQGIGCNEIDEQNDTRNFLVLLQQLRSHLDSKYKSKKQLITLAVRADPFYENGKPIKDASKFYDVLDFINIMAYDINGGWNRKTGPNAPLRTPSNYETELSCVNSIKQWTSAQFKPDKIVMGLAFYGRAFQLEKEINEITKPRHLNVEFSPKMPRGDKEDALWAEACPGSKKTFSGIWQWKNLREQKIIVSKEGTQVNSSAGWYRIFDASSQTPWLYNSKTKQLISYDDPQSLLAKVESVKCYKLKGIMLWALHQDNEELLESVQSIRDGKINERKCIVKSRYSSKNSPSISLVMAERPSSNLEKENESQYKDNGKLQLPSKII